MLRPERMSRVSVTGSKQVLEDVIEAVHDLRLLHVTEYDGSWEGFEPGDPLEGGDEASNKLVTVRALESILDVEAEDAGPTQLVTDEAIDEELEEIRQEVNELDDRRNELREELRSVEEKIGTIEPFATVGIDMDLLSGYESLSVAVGVGDAEGIDAALAESEDVDAHEVFSENNALAVFAHPAEGVTDFEIGDELVGVEFQAYEIPDAEGSPEEYVEELRHRREQLESRLETVENDLEDVKLDVGGFLLATEEKLSIEAQKAEAPLTYATTENAFIAEGWIPTTEFDEFVATLETEVGEHVEIEELERAEDDGEGHVSDRHSVDEGGDVPGEPAAADGGEAATDGGEPTASADDGKAKAADGGHASSASVTSSDAKSDGGIITMGTSDPPVIQDNPGPVRPFEALVEVINRPKYSEFDPTVILFLTFPAFFGFMIGDLGYGILYLLLGYWIYSSFDSDVVRSLGGIAMWAGGFTALFGVLYGEIFGLHELGEILFGGNPPMHKGLQPAEIAYAQAWLILSLVLGLLHLTVGYIFDFVENLSHGIVDAVTESLSWVLLMVGAWAWIFSTHLIDSKPEFLFAVFSAEGSTLATGTEATEEMVAYSLGFTGLPETVGLAGLAVAGLGLLLLIVGEGVIGLLESLNVLVNVLSYTRIAAVLLAKAGMAFVVNLLFFGAYTHHGEFHFMIDHGPQWVIGEYGEAAIMFEGLWNMGAAGLVGGIVVLVVGHLLVLALGITSAGLQAVRLEYVEFFGKFYEGGGKSYNPFGYQRRYTTED